MGDKCYMLRVMRMRRYLFETIAWGPAKGGVRRSKKRYRAFSIKKTILNKILPTNLLKYKYV